MTLRENLFDTILMVAVEGRKSDRPDSRRDRAFESDVSKRKRRERRSTGHTVRDWRVVKALAATKGMQPRNKAYGLGKKAKGMDLYYFKSGYPETLSEDSTRHG